MKEIKLAYGLRNERIIHIDELEEHEHGLACNCICPSCGKKLLAKIGTKNRHHFSHNSDNCSVETTTQTAIHLLAKEIISTKGKLQFPGIFVSYSDTKCYDYRYNSKVESFFEAKKARSVYCDEVHLEKKLESIVPDIIFIKGNYQCIIEIAVTHFVDDKKSAKIRELNLFALEINLSKYYDSQEFDRNAFEHDIIDNCNNRKWIHYPAIDELYQKADNYYKGEIDRIMKEELAKEAERKRYAELYQIEQKKKYERKLKQYRSDEITNASINKLAFYQFTKEKQIPFFLDIPIDGEIIFKCDRRIWQCAIFDKFIFNRTTTYLSIFKINQWIINRQNLFKIDWNIIKKNNYNTYHILEQYLNYLSFLGFISDLYNQEATVLHPHKLNPPNQKYAHLLYSAIASINAYTQHPNAEIEKYLTEAYGIYFF